VSEKVSSDGQEATPDSSSVVAEADAQTNPATDQVSSEPVSSGESASSGVSEPAPDAAEVTTSSHPETITPGAIDSKTSESALAETTAEMPGEQSNHAETKTEANLDEIALKTEAELAAASASASGTPAEPEDVVFLPEEEPDPTVESAQASTEGHLEELTEEIVEPEPSEPHPEKIALEGGEFVILSKDRAGRYLATSPDGQADGRADGQTVQLSTYNGDVVLMRSLYPHPMLPDLIDAGDFEGHTLLAHPKPEGRTLEQAFTANQLQVILAALVDLARFNRYLVARGAALIGLDLSGVLLEPTRFAKLPLVRRVSEMPPAEAPRYVAPERASGLFVKGDEGAFTLGSVLYHAVEGHALGEGEIPLEFPEKPGVPQVLTALLAPTPGRASPSEALELLDQLQMHLAIRRRWNVGAASSVGLNPDRSANEDALGWRYVRTLGNAGREGAMVGCIADGMGGMARGEIASQAAVETFLEYAPEWASNPRDKNAENATINAEAVRQRVMHANAMVQTALEGKAGGCTFTGMIADGPKVFIGHVGDTRAYRVHTAQKKVSQITEDHSMVQMLVRMGVITSEEAHGHPDSNKVTRALGANKDLDRDYIDTFEFVADAGDRIVIVCDGVWGAIEPKRYQAILLEPVSVQDLADKMVSAAMSAGSNDNVTALVLEYEERPPF
jgi:PPM family protein phosphatase